MVSSWILVVMAVTSLQGHLGYVSGPIAHLDMSIAPSLSLVASDLPIDSQTSSPPVFRNPLSLQQGSASSDVNLLVNPPIKPLPGPDVNPPKDVSQGTGLNPPKTPSVMAFMTPKTPTKVTFPPKPSSSSMGFSPPKHPSSVLPVAFPPRTPSFDTSLNPSKRPFHGMAPGMAFPSNKPSPGLSYLPPHNPPQGGMNPHNWQQGVIKTSTMAPQNYNFFQEDYSDHYSNAPQVFPQTVNYHHNLYQHSHPGVFFPSEQYRGHSIFKRQVFNPQSGPFFNSGRQQQNGFNSGFGNWGNGNQNRPNFNAQQPWWNNNPNPGNPTDFENTPFVPNRPGRPNPGRPSPNTQAPPPTQAPPGGFTEEATVPTAGTTIRGCTCPTTPEFNPVCGQDRVTYFNAGRLRCANQCGNRVALAHGGSCITTTTPAVTPPSILNQRRRQG